MEYITIKFLNDAEAKPVEHGSFINNLPFATTSLLHLPIKNVQYLTKGEDVKTVLEITLKLELDIQYEPGDTIGILPQNNEEEVDQIIKLLNLEDVCDNTINVGILEGTKKKNAAVPSHIPLTTTIRSLLRNNLDIRAAPKKMFLRTLHQHTTDPHEAQQLFDVCENSAKYIEFLQDSPYLLKTLQRFPSCQPPFERLLEHLPSLKPRPYSISSTPRDGGELRFVFCLVREISPGGFNGVCTDYLFKTGLRFGSGKTLPVYFRKPNAFRLPRDPEVPVIMIGPGTGVGPFMGFLRRRKIAGYSVLYFGCRYSERDFLFKEELNGFLGEGVLDELRVVFSREGIKSERYVQDLIAKDGEKFVKLLLDKNATLYVCGDAKNMGADVRDAVKRVIGEFKEVSEEESSEIVKRLQRDLKYVEDLWT